MHSVILEVARGDFSFYLVLTSSVRIVVRVVQTMCGMLFAGLHAG